MKMTFRWYGEGNDKITLPQIKQIPGVEGIVWSLHDMPAGELWDEKRIESAVEYIQSQGFNADVVESVNVHEDIKLGLPTRDKYIDNYKQTLRLLAKHGVKVVCYNFNPVPSSPSSPHSYLFLRCFPNTSSHSFPESLSLPEFPPFHLSLPLLLRYT